MPWLPTVNRLDFEGLLSSGRGSTTFLLGFLLRGVPGLTLEHYP